jgi:hypothetical protein
LARFSLNLAAAIQREIKRDLFHRDHDVSGAPPHVHQVISMEVVSHNVSDFSHWQHPVMHTMN